MAPYAPSALFALFSAVTLVVAQDATTSALTFAPTPLDQLHFPTPADAPEQVFGPVPAFERGPQTGYNRCNSTTEGPTSLCQTAFVSGLDDFCLWAPPNPSSTIADSEGEVVGFCTKKGHGTRIMTEGTLLGVQLLKSNDYWMLTGLIDQTKLNMVQDDSGGELDSGGQDGRGNPIGGLIYSTAFNGTVAQVNHWTEFIGNGQFCIKICNPSGSNPAGFCQHTLDRIGLGYNCPSKYTVGGGTQPGDFEICDTEDMGIPGVYTDASGATMSYAQPPESLGAITSIPYQPTTVASSNCQKTASSAIFTELVSATGSPAASSTGSGSGSVAGSATATGSKATGASGSSTGSSTASATGGASNGAARLAAGSALTALVSGFVFIAVL